MTTVQDRGRWGRQHEGVPVSGAMDRAAMDDANRAVWNAPAAATLEVTLGGADVRLEHAGRPGGWLARTCRRRWTAGRWRRAHASSTAPAVW
jgi:allophanate hydrolase subunit 2